MLEISLRTSILLLLLAPVQKLHFKLMRSISVMLETGYMKWCIRLRDFNIHTYLIWKLVGKPQIVLEAVTKT